MNIGERIKQRRIALGLSVDEIAKQIGKNRATIYRYESSEIENLPTSVLEPLAKALHTTPAILMGWEQPLKIILLNDDYEQDNDTELSNEEVAILQHYRNADIDTKLQVLGDLEIRILGTPVGENRYIKLTKEQRITVQKYLTEISNNEDLFKLIQNFSILTNDGQQKLLDYSNDLLEIDKYKK